MTEQWSGTSRKVTYLWYAPNQQAFIAPAVEITCRYDPAAFAQSDHLEWALETALHQLRTALATELEGDTHAHKDQEGSG